MTRWLTWPIVLLVLAVAFVIWAIYLMSIPPRDAHSVRPGPHSRIVLPAAAGVEAQRAG